MEYDPLADHEQAGRSASRGRLRTFFAQLNPFSSYWRRAPEDLIFTDSLARQEAEVKAGRPRDDYMMTLDVIGEVSHRGPRFQRWMLPTMVVIFGLALSLSFVDHRFWGWLIGLQLLIGVVLLVLALQGYASLSRFRAAADVSVKGGLAEAADLLAKGDTDSAISLMKLAVAEKPNTLGGRLLLAQTYSFAGRLDTAVQVAREAVDMFPQHPWPRQLLGEIYKSQGKADDAITELEKAVNLADAIEGLDHYKRQAQKSMEDIKKLRHP